MAERSQEIQVGIIFIIAVALLISGVLWFKEFRIGGKTHTLVVEFENTSGLQKGDPVEVRGVTSGRVSAIDYIEGEARVSLTVDRDVVVYPGTRVVIENVGIMGQKLVAVYPGSTATVLPDSVVLRGEYQSGIPSLMADLGSSLDSFDRLADSIEALLDGFDKSDQENMSRILSNTEQVTADLAVFLKETRGDLAEVVENFNLAMADIHGTLDGREETIDRALDNASRAAARLDSALVVLQGTARRTDRILAGVEEGEGTLGLLAKDPELYHQLHDALEEARLLMADMKENPRKYVKLSVF